MTRHLGTMPPTVPSLASPRPAATVIVLREGDAGPEVLMLKRSAKSGFFPHAWVFPGGRVDPSDAEVAVQGRVLGLEDEQHAFAVAALRECFEEAGVWLGGGVPPDGFRDLLNAREATLLDAPQLVAHLDRLELWAWWVTPGAEPKRYDTAFFVVWVQDEEMVGASPDEVETVSSRWVRPADALEEVDAATFFLAPPTFRCLEELARFDSCREAMAWGANRSVRPCMPRLDLGEGSVAIVLPGDPSYPSAEPAEGPKRIVLRDGRWVSEG